MILQDMEKPENAELLAKMRKLASSESLSLANDSRRIYKQVIDKAARLKEVIGWRDAAADPGAQVGIGIAKTILNTRMKRLLDVLDAATTETKAAEIRDATLMRNALGRIIAEYDNPYSLEYENAMNGLDEAMLDAKTFVTKHLAMLPFDEDKEAKPESKRVVNA